MNGWTTLEFTSPDPCRTSLVNQDRKVIYTASTDEPLSGGHPVTTYTDASGYVFASLEWRMCLSDNLQIGQDGEKRVVGKWLKKGKGGLGKKAETRYNESSGETYAWRGFEKNGPLQLYSSDSSSPIANFAPALRGPNKGDPILEPANLRLSSHLTISKEAQDHAILSLLLIEKARRFGGPIATAVPTNWALLFYGVLISLTSSRSRPLV